MLVRLFVENFALAERIELTFGPGLAVLTGETGAGKSLIVDALAMLQGARGAADFIRTGAPSAVIEAAFRVDEKAVLAALAARGIAADDEVVVRRVLSRDGRHRTFVNGAQTPAGAAAEITERLFELHGQHEPQTLLAPAAHLELLDEAAASAAAREAYAELFTARAAAAAERAALEAAAREREQKLDYLKFQVEEIGKIAPRAGEWDELEAARKRLQNADRLAAACAESDEALYAGEASVAQRLRVVAKRLDEAARFDARFTAWAAEAKEVSVRAEELARALADYAGRIEADPARLDAANARLDELARLRKKYGELDSLPAKLEAMKTELDSLEHSDQRLAALSTEVERLDKAVRDAGLKLREKRKKAAGPFAAKIAEKLRPLGMPEAVLEWSFGELAQPSPTGLDAVELLLSANRGEPARPLHKVASGGELSRVMLALHTVALQAGGPQCVIFDEIDAGIGGDVGHAVGAAMRAVAAKRQVICVTHLAQIAAHARDHWLVKKSVAGERTVSAAAKLTAKERQDEIGRMLGGMADETARKHARALIERAGA
jgi:DNA repair protein RecN (Recombination protein N)